MREWERPGFLLNCSYLASSPPVWLEEEAGIFGVARNQRHKQTHRGKTASRQRVRTEILHRRSVCDSAGCNSPEQTHLPQKNHPSLTTMLIFKVNTDECSCRQVRITTSKSKQVQLVTCCLLANVQYLVPAEVSRCSRAPQEAQRD